MDPAEPLFDAHLHPEGLSDQDLESMRLFGVEAALVPAHHRPPEPTAKALLAHFEDIVRVQLPRLERAGIRGYAALGVHPRCVPRRGLGEVLAALPDYFGLTRVVALGEVGLHRGTEEEEEAFAEQLQLARKLKLPVLVHTPHREKDRVTRRALRVLRASGLLPRRAMVDHASLATARLILECGHYAGLTVHPEELSAEAAVRLIRKVGPERLMLDSDAGDGAGDILGLSRGVRLLEKAKLSRKVVQRVAFSNAAVFLELPRR